MVFARLKQACLSLKDAVASSLPFCGPPLDYGLSLLSKEACEAAAARPAPQGPPGTPYGSVPYRTSRDGAGARLYCRLPDPGRFSGEAGMNEVVMIDRSQTEQILQTAIEHKVTAIMSYLSKGKWHVAKVFATAIEAGKLSVQTMHSQDKQHPINININQPVGVSFKYEYGKFVFDTTVVGLEPARPGGADTGGTLVLAVPEEIEVIQRRSYFRVEVPKSLKVNVTLWRRKSGDGRPAAPPSRQTPQVSRASCPRTEGGTPSTPGGDQGRYARGRLVDISAGGAQIVLDDPGDGSPGEPHFRTGQFIGIRFTPLPYETPLVLNAQIRNALPRADGDSIYLGLQIVGLEASPEGRQVLARLVGVVERFYKMNQAQAEKKPKTPAQATA
ncbi:MAG TPA: PilZ domain-containing protein [Sedimentisphaerales bacterium]|nr:PilZ domain-containing protein [Sedimentisphaerales bacterium]